jgi:hypothetical protein
VLLFLMYEQRQSNIPDIIIKANKIPKLTQRMILFISTMRDLQKPGSDMIGWAIVFAFLSSYLERALRMFTKDSPHLISCISLSSKWRLDMGGCLRFQFRSVLRSFNYGTGMLKY